MRAPRALIAEPRAAARRTALTLTLSHGERGPDRRLLAGLFLFALLFPTLLRADFVEVEKKPAESKLELFDPAHPPANRPKFYEGEVGCCAANYTTDIALGFDPAPAQHVGDKTTVKLRINKVRMTLALVCTLWLPKDHTDKQMAHERAHEKISNLSYAHADTVARAIGKTFVDKAFEGQGATEADAMKDALTKAAVELHTAYDQATTKTDKDVQDRFDAITEHGTNDVPEADAIKQALKPPPASKPAKPSTKP